MRMWSFHPKYLDPKGFVAEWRETLLARNVLKGLTKGWVKHPQLNRFRKAKDQIGFINRYLCVIYEDSVRRNYHFDKNKLCDDLSNEVVEISKEDLLNEWNVYLNKIKKRSNKLYKTMKYIKIPELHPCFIIN